MNQFFQAVRHHGWDLSLRGTATFYPEDYPKGTEQLPRALSEHVIAQVERAANLERFDNPAYELTTRILIRCGLRVSDALKLSFDCIIEDGDGELHTSATTTTRCAVRRSSRSTASSEISSATSSTGSSPASPTEPRSCSLARSPTLRSKAYREALGRWLCKCDVRDERGQPVHLTPHQWRHFLGTTLINLDVPQEVVRKLLDHDSHQMVAHYARLSDTTIRRHWEKARKVNLSGEVVTLDPAGPLAEASWAKSASRVRPRHYPTATADCRF